MLTLYTSLIEHQVINQKEISHLIDTIICWYQNATNEGIGGRANMHMEILLMCFYYYSD